MPTFCRHNRFIERCPICSKTLPGNAPSGAGTPRARGAARAGAPGSSVRGRRVRGEAVRVHREGRAEDDGFRSPLVPGVRASADAQRLAEEIAFSSGRLLGLATEPPDLYGEVRALAGSDLERASWICFLIVYLSPLEGEDPFAGIRMALGAGTPIPEGELPDLDGVPLGPHTSHDPARGLDTLLAYRQWVERGGRAGAAAAPSSLIGVANAGTQAAAFSGDPAWTPERRFERLFERLALPGFGRMGRYDMLVMLGRLGLYDMRPGSLQMAGAPADDVTTLAAKRVFGIGDPILLDRRAAALAEAAATPIETLDLALANWASPQRATMGFPVETRDEGAHERALDALGL
jgi:hypothetical protein